VAFVFATPKPSEGGSTAETKQSGVCRRERLYKLSVLLDEAVQLEMSNSGEER